MGIFTVVALVIAFVARKIARRPPDERMTFGYGRIEIVAALINYTTLILVGVYLINFKKFLHSRVFIKVTQYRPTKLLYKMRNLSALNSVL